MARNCPQCDETLGARATSCPCGWRAGTGGGKGERHRPEVCALCQRDGVTERDLWPLRSLDNRGELEPLRWAHDACRRPTMRSARRVDSWARGETTHPDVMFAAAIGAAIDIARNRVSDDDRRDLMQFLKDRLRAGPSLPYRPDERLSA